MKKVAPTLPVPVGTPVWFLQFGQDVDEPMPATVIKCSDNLVCRLLVTSRDGVVTGKMAVYPLGHPSLKDDKGAPSLNARRNGAWAYHPWFMPKQDEDADMIRKLFDEHGSVEEVFKRVRSKGISKSTVAEVLGQDS